MKHAPLWFAAFLLALCLSGCSASFETEYYSEETYIPVIQENPEPSEKVTVRNFSELKQAIRNMVYAGESEGTISFDPLYDGESKDDMPSACWQVRTQNALCAYCVQDISYELSRIVTHDEAAIHIRYAESAGAVSEVVQLTYATGLETLLRQAMENNRQRLVILISASSYSADQMERLVMDVYHDNPVCSVSEPQPDVYMYSGTGRQRLYEINLDYGLSEDEIIRRKSLMRNLDVAANIDADGLDEAHLALVICEYLASSCEISHDESRNTAYDALIQGEANSEGIALAYIEMCHQLGIECRIVYGQLAWQDHCWNIISVGSEHYHVDVSVCASDGMSYGFLRSDESMWTEYRWDTSAYDACHGELTYEQIAGIDEPSAETLDEPPRGDTDSEGNQDGDEPAEPTSELDDPTEEPDDPSKENEGSKEDSAEP